ncbi:MAG: spondin domain-containing protein [Gammaproteobacteria bacterium]|nr:spondin domain-containing protein [Gammaproteobacteria bacterium]MDH3751910.1 spondin domain-containing protein [Gammaproteobacteria bacterium]MDH3804254.1 spondin domain-containing protein [Gammaproteobacteria bacterium]
MHVIKKTRITYTLFGMASLLLLPALAMASGGNKYKVTITNLTPGQPFTPPVLVVHNNRTGIFDLGEEASAEIQAIAENGNNEPLVTALAGDVYVRQWVEGTAPIVPANNPGGTPFESSASFTISPHGNARYLSIVSMLICTNDGFMGIDTVRLPVKKRTVYAVAYDARTETNTEDFADMVPPCQGLIGVSSDDMGTGMTDPLLTEEGTVIPHVGIHGGVDLKPQVHGWSDPVAEIVIERVRH